LLAHEKILQNILAISIAQNSLKNQTNIKHTFTMGSGTLAYLSLLSTDV